MHLEVLKFGLHGRGEDRENGVVEEGQEDSLSKVNHEFEKPKASPSSKPLTGSTDWSSFWERQQRPSMFTNHSPIDEAWNVFSSLYNYHLTWS